MQLLEIHRLLVALVEAGETSSAHGHFTNHCAEEESDRIAGGVHPFRRTLSLSLIES